MVARQEAWGREARGSYQRDRRLHDTVQTKSLCYQQTCEQQLAASKVLSCVRDWLDTERLLSSENWQAYARYL